MATPASPSHPLTPPAETQPTNAATSTQPTQPSQTTTTNSDSTTFLLSEPLTSLQTDPGKRQPRDQRLIHLLLSAYGVSSYQERVPLQLMDFAYRYTSSVLSDAAHLTNEGYDQNAEPTANTNANNTAAGAAAPSAPQGKGRGRAAKNNEDGDITLSALRMAISGRLHHQFNSTLPKEFLKQMADEKNRVALGPAVKEGEKNVVGGLRLPNEKYVLGGVGWGVKGEWESEGEESDDETMGEINGTAEGDARALGGDDTNVEKEEGMEDEDDEGAGRMEDVFGEEPGGTTEDRDTDMQL